MSQRKGIQMKTFDILGMYWVHYLNQLYSVAQKNFKSDEKITQSVRDTGSTPKSNLATYSTVLVIH